MELLIDCWNGRLAHSLPAERDVQRNKRESRILRGRLGTVEDDGQNRQADDGAHDRAFDQIAQP